MTNGSTSSLRRSQTQSAQGRRSLRRVGGNRTSVVTERSGAYVIARIDLKQLSQGTAANSSGVSARPPFRGAPQSSPNKGTSIQSRKARCVWLLRQWGGGRGV